MTYHLSRGVKKFLGGSLATARFFLGVDGGATRCRARLRDTSGRELGHSVGPASNIYVDFDAAVRVVRETIDSVIAPGATVTGEIAGVKKGILRGGKKTFRLLTVAAVDGSSVKVSAAPGKGSDRAEQSIEPPGRRDKSLLAPAGSTYLAYIDGPQTVQMKK